MGIVCINRTKEIVITRVGEAITTQEYNGNLRKPRTTYPEYEIEIKMPRIKTFRTVCSSRTRKLRQSCTFSSSNKEQTKERCKSWWWRDPSWNVRDWKKYRKFQQKGMTERETIRTLDYDELYG